MSEPAPDFATRRFQTASAHYLAGRAPYPTALIARVASLTGVDASSRVLDLGCGPGLLAERFAPLAGAVLALDPEPTMLALARERLAGMGNVTVAEGRSDTLHPAYGRFRLCAIGRAFHWMDRADTLRRLDALLEPHGAVALFSDDHLAVAENAWVETFETIVDRYAGTENRAVRAATCDAAHMEALLASAFCVVERVGVVWRHVLAPGAWVERALSRSTTSRAGLGARADEMVAELTSAEAAWRATGGGAEVLMSEAVLAWRKEESAFFFEKKNQKTFTGAPAPAGDSL